MTKNEYIPFRSEILEVIEHTPIEYTFRMAFNGDVKPGQFFEVSLPKYGEAPISVSGIGEGYVDLTIRRVGKVTNEIFKNYVTMQNGQLKFALLLCSNSISKNKFLCKSVKKIKNKECAQH